MIGSLFTGYGGLDMATQAVTGLPLAFVSDIEPGPIAAQAHHHPHVPNVGDVTAVDWAPWRGHIDVLTGGFPCQDVSLAGRRAGLIRDGEGRTRSGLWGHMLRAVTELSPTLVVIENVRGLLSAAADSDVEPCPWCLGGANGEPDMRALGAVLADLADAGYDARWCGLRAADVGACHGRYRVFILAHARDADRVDSYRRRATGLARKAGPSAGLQVMPTLRASDGNRLPTPGANLGTNGGSQHPDKRAVGGHSVSLQDVIEHVDFGKYAAAVERHAAVLGRPAPAPTEPAPRGGRRLSAKFVEWMMMLPEGHVTDVPGLSRNAQLRLLGNGVVPLQAEVALKTCLTDLDVDEGV